MRTKIIAILLVSLLILTSCSKAKPDDTVSSFFNKLITGDYEAAYAFVEGDIENALDLDKTSERAAELIFSKVSFNIKSSSVNGNTAIVSTEIVAPNLPVIIGQVMSSALPMAFASAFSEDANSTQEAINQFVEETLINLLSDPNVSMTTTTIDIQLQKGETGWKIIANDDLANAITGGAVKAFEKFNQAP